MPIPKEIIDNSEGNKLVSFLNNEDKPVTFYPQTYGKEDITKKLWYQKKREHRNEWKRQDRLKLADKMKQRDRMQYWRKRQKILALQQLKINGYSTSPYDLNDSVPTFALSYLLKP